MIVSTTVFKQEEEEGEKLLVSQGNLCVLYISELDPTSFVVSF